MNCNSYRKDKSDFGGHMSHKINSPLIEIGPNEDQR